MRVVEPPLDQSEADIAEKLPRGPHALPPAVVVANQRERLLDAATRAIAEEGYAELTVRSLIDKAGVSRRTFYQLFEDKDACVFAAHERSFGRLSDAIVGACRTRAAWPDRVANAVARALDFAVESPDDAQLVVIASHAASEPKLASRGHAAHEKLADLLRTGRRQAEVANTPPDVTEQAVIGAAMAVVGTRLLKGEVADLRALAPELTQIVLTPYLGEERAHSVANRPAPYGS
jgi:AcrR family transcriptional regulator